MSQYNRDAVTAALAGDWNTAHHIVMQHNDPLACWIHAVLHKMQGDAENSRYWYAKSAHGYTEFQDAREELQAIQTAALQE